MAEFLSNSEALALIVNSHQRNNDLLWCEISEKSFNLRYLLLGQEEYYDYCSCIFHFSVSIQCGKESYFGSSWKNHNSRRILSRVKILSFIRNKLGSFRWKKCTNLIWEINASFLLMFSNFFVKVLLFCTTCNENAGNFFLLLFGMHIKWVGPVWENPEARWWRQVATTYESLP